MSLSSENDREGSDDVRESEGGPNEARRADDDRSLDGDLAEVERARPERAFNVGAVLGVIVSVAAAVFVVQNSRSTSFDWLWFEFRMPLWAALVGAVAAGVVLVVTVLTVHHRRRRRIDRRHEATARLRRFVSRRRGEATDGGAGPMHRRRRPRPTESGSPE